MIIEIVINRASGIDLGYPLAAGRDILGQKISRSILLSQHIAVQIADVINLILKAIAVYTEIVKDRVFGFTATIRIDCFEKQKSLSTEMLLS